MIKSMSEASWEHRLRLTCSGKLRDNSKVQLLDSDSTRKPEGYREFFAVPDRDNIVQLLDSDSTWNPDG